MEKNDKELLTEMILQTPRRIVHGMRSGKTWLWAQDIAEYLLSRGVQVRPKNKRFFIKNNGAMITPDLLRGPTMVIPRVESQIIPLREDCWILASVELPSRKSCVKHYSMYGASPQFIVMIFGAIFPTVLSFDGNEFFNEETNETYRVTHWMELPVPPMEEEV